MKKEHKHSQHSGELAVQRRRNTPDLLASSIPNFIETQMPRQQADFYAGLSYLPLATLDDRGRPWASILVTESLEDADIGISLNNEGKLKLTAQMSPNDPFLLALGNATASASESDSSRVKPLFAGVGVDFSNRRRNKLSGKIENIDLSANGKIALQLDSDEHLGNCPKYITVRELKPHTRVPQLELDQRERVSTPLPQAAKDLINQASTVFFATKHDAGDDETVSKTDMGLNHRGGQPGFVRLYEKAQSDAIQTFLVLPDFSGNRFYQSLGNVESSKLVGLVFPDFTTGDMLYVTGEAENLYDEKAEQLMPRISLLTQVRVTGAVFIRSALSLRLESPEILSPYNPPLRFLSVELGSMGHPEQTVKTNSQTRMITLSAHKKLNDHVSTFTFKLPEPIEVPAPGGFGVFDFSKLLDQGYSHMNELNPQAINEDYIRTWTLSSSPRFNPQSLKFDLTDEISITVKKQERGLVSGFLHDQYSSLKTLTNEGDYGISLKGIGGQFSCFDFSENHSIPKVPSKMLWMAGGVGITPFMSMWDGLISLNRALVETQKAPSTDILLVFAGRGDDIKLLEHFVENAGEFPETLKLKLLVYQTNNNDELKTENQAWIDKVTASTPELELVVHKERMRLDDLKNVNDILERDTFMCGPDTLMMSARDWLEEYSGGEQKIYHESYSF